MVLSDEQRIGLYVAVPCYFVMFFTMGILGWRSKVRRAREQTATSEMENHFVAGKSLGTFVSVMTIFASLFSGYTMVGVPNEAFANGFTALRWIPSKLFMAFGYMGTSPRLRRISLIRGYHSPLDFITDRFRSQTLRYTLLIVLLVPSIIYLAAQPITLQKNFNELFGLDEGNPVAPICVAIFILVLEWIGGLNVVAYTDAAQGLLMVLAFVLMASTLCSLYGGFAGEAFNPTTYPEPTFFQVPTTERQLAMWTFSIQWTSFLALPHFQQRTYASGSFKSMRLAYFVVTLAPWLTMMVGVFSGTLGVYLLRDEENVQNPFTAVIAQVMNASGFGYFAGLLVLVGSIAAIISTADSLLIASAHMIMAEVHGEIWPKASEKRISFAGKVVSGVVMGLALLIALTDDGALSDLADMQNGMLFQACPAIVIGLFFSPRFTPHPFVIAIGAAIGFCTVAVIKYGYNGNDDNYEFNAGVWGMGHNLGVMVAGEFIVRTCKYVGAPSWDTPSNLSRFGEVHINHEWLCRLMRNIKEPWRSTYFVPIILVISILLLPGNSAGLPELGEQAADGSYPDFAPTTVGGLPDWVFKLLMASLVTTLLLLYATYQLPSDLDDLSDVKDLVDANIKGAPAAGNEMAKSQAEGHEAPPTVVRIVSTSTTASVMNEERGLVR